MDMLKRIAFLLLALTLALSIGLPLAGQDLERTSDESTAWWWFTGVSSETLGQALSTHSARLIDLEVTQVSPLRFSASMVRNSGSYASGWWWYYGITGSRLSELLTEHTARILDLEVYLTSGGLRYAVILVPNSGTQAKAWWWLSNVTFADLSAFVSRNGARVVDLEVIEQGSTRTYAAVMIRNRGADQAAWWWYSGVSLGTLASELAANNARLIDLERRSDGTLAAVAVRPQGESWWWYVGLDFEGVKDRVALTGARIVDIERYAVSGQPRYAVVLTGNGEDAATRVGMEMNAGTDGEFGYYLKRMNGPVLAAFHEEQPFYPASTIKALQLAYTLSQVPNADAMDSTSATYYPIAGESCLDLHPASHTSLTQTLRWLAEQMMRPSNNQTTNALMELAGGGVASAGRTLINAFASGPLGMSPATVLNHKLGCNGPSSNPPNRMILSDIARLYERVIGGGVFPIDRVIEFHDIMLNETNSFPASLRAVIEDEAAMMGKQDLVEAFIDEILFAQKGGNIGTSYLSIAGWIELPFGHDVSSTTSTSETQSSVGSTSRSSSTSTSSSTSVASEATASQVSERLRHRDRPATGSPADLPLAADAYERRAYTFGLFIDNASTIDLDGDGTPLSLFVLMAELLRDEIREALTSW